ncbi:MAG TPA: hypothetical protein P5117_05895 [Spirochaetia bacterium]|nr:hypothetical protein [Spirochaetales bacterium]HRY80736.1 hypothetical protein [Spirochaetia bacterium]HRZ89000.1 hypothetical protein [Spirochaetia bacterium]
MIRPAIRASGALLLCALTASCAPIPPAPFALRGEDGAVHPLTPDSRFPEGLEGTIGGDGRTSARYALKDPVRVRGARTALEIRYELAGAARLEIFPEGRGAPPLVSSELPVGAGRIRWLLPLPAGTELSSFRFTALPAGPESKAAASTLRIEALALVPAFFGFESLPEGARFSRGSSLARSASGSETVRIEHPFGPGEDPVIRIDSAARPLRIRAEGGRSAVLDAGRPDGVFLPLSALGGSGAVTVEASGTEPIRAASVLPSRDLPGPLPLDLAVVLALPPPADSRFPYQLYRWSAFPECLVFDFRDYAAQDTYLKRLAFFVEKEGFRGRLAPDSEIARLHGWNAHDYRSEDLAAFFDKAGRTAFPLSPEEVELRGILEREGILVREGNRFKPGTGVIISISRESTTYLRDLFLTHEAAHALFFLDDAYRNLARSLWTAQGPEERRFWNVFLSNRDYDPSDAYLSYNELQAYLVQQIPSRLESWLKDVAYARLAKSYPDRAAAILADLEAALPGFKAKAEALDAYLRKTYGFRGGSFRRLRFE